MMHPEMMQIVINSHHEYLRSLAKRESVLDELQSLSRSPRNALGRGMVRTGRWLGGHAPTTIQPDPPVTFQEP